jgi:hypothetical protein
MHFEMHSCDLNVLFAGSVDHWVFRDDVAYWHFVELLQLFDFLMPAQKFTYQV